MNDSNTNLLSSGPIWIVDDDEVRNTIRFALATHGIHARTFSSGEDFFSNVQIRQKGVLVVDLHMHGMSGLDVQAELIRRESPIATIILSGRPTIRSAVQAMNNGAISFLEKPVDPEELCHRIQIGLQISECRYQRKTMQALIDGLSKREKQVFDYICQGHRNSEIAEILHLSTRTVEVHRAHILRKFAPYSPMQILDILNQCNATLARRMLNG